MQLSDYLLHYLLQIHLQRFQEKSEIKWIGNGTPRNTQINVFSAAIGLNARDDSHLNRHNSTVTHLPKDISASGY